MSTTVSAIPGVDPRNGLRLGLAVLIPVGALAAQWALWPLVQPYVWFLFYPAVFFSSWVGGLRGGILATGLSAVLVWYCFIPPQFSFAVERPISWVSIALFVGMGLLFSGSHERLRSSNRRLAAAMAEAQRVSEQLLRESEERFDLVLKTSPNALVVVADDGRIARANPPAERLFGYGPGGLRGVAVDALVPAHQRSAHAHNRREFAAHPTARPMGAGRELTAARADGAVFPVEISLAPLTIEGAPYVVASVVDISDRKRAEMEIQQLNAGLERRVEERTSELLAANQELDAFVYAVSHDLRAPLRAMSGFSQALIEDHGAGLAAEARGYLDQIIQASRRMGALIDGLLTLSRSTRGELHREPVDLTALATRLLRELEAAEPGRVVSWTVEPGLTAVGDVHMIEVVLTNLLSNAWKYTATTAHPTIRVAAERNGALPTFQVADNGAGFDPRHAGRLFQPFQRLHRQDEFPGVGVGLATAHRIVRRHGGTLQATAAPGRGATFSFTLPSPDRPTDSPTL